MQSNNTTFDQASSSTFPSNSDSWLAYVVEVLAQAGTLTSVQTEIVECLLLGRAYADIARIRDRSPHTIGVQVKEILRRLGATNSRDLFRIFLCELERKDAPPVPMQASLEALH